MSVVQAYHRDRAGNVELIGIYDGDRVKAHSARIRDMISTQDPGVIFQVRLEGPTFAALRVVLNSIHTMQRDRVLDIKITTRDLAKVIDIHRATLYLKVEPEQTRMVGHLNGYVSHQIINPDEMIAVYLTYGHRTNPNHKIFCTMVQTLAFNCVGGNIPQQMADYIKESALRHPDLDAALNAKVNELQKIKDRRQKQAEKKAARKAGGRR
jgi:hypothetical protein